MSAALTPLEALALQPAAQRAAAIAAIGADRLRTDWALWAQPGQRPPAGDWRIWLLMAGRGFGKTRAGAEWVRGIAERDGDARIALVGATMAEARSIMVEGISGLLSIAPRRNRPKFEPSRNRLVWRNGAQALLYSGENPESLRGPEHSHAWCDELAKWSYVQASWDNLQLGLRLGAQPQVLVTTTPRPIALLRTLLAARARSGDGAGLRRAGGVRLWDQGVCAIGLSAAWRRCVQLRRPDRHIRAAPNGRAARWRHAHAASRRASTVSRYLDGDEPHSRPCRPAQGRRESVRAQSAAHRCVATAQGGHMATLILTAVGTAIGGPIGGATGAIIGQQVDQAIFAPPGRQGPRLSDVSAQTSSYGKPIPKLFGTNRVAGNVIWATDLKETSSTSGGKGQPSVTTYSYSASFAVALSARPISGIGRIWADGNLLRGMAGDWKETLGVFRMYLGNEDQPIDPLIAAAEGIAQTPAHRGMAYVVFENLLLDNFGRRVPSLTFEVLADGGAISLATIITTLAGDGVVASAPEMFGGYAASGDSVRGAVETLTAAVPVRVQDDGQTLRVVDQVPTALPIARDALGTATGGSKVQRLNISRQSASTIADTLVLAYYDIARDYQQGMQRARRDGGARKESRLNLPVTLDATSAKTLVENRLAGLWAERVTATIQLPWRYLALRPGDDVIVPGSDDVWRVSAIKFNKMVLACDLVRTIFSTSMGLTADPGRGVVQLDAPAGPTTIVLLDLPLLSDGVATQPNVTAAANGASVGWRSAALLQSLDDGASSQAAGTTALPATMGMTVSRLAAGSSTLIDRINSVDIQLLNDEMQLSDTSDALLLSGANLAILGGELLQFGSATPLGANRWRLMQLWRGRRGTEDRIATHTIGEPFVLLDATTLKPLIVPNGVSLLRASAQGVGDVLPLPESDLPLPGMALRPPSPVALTATVQPNGDTVISWIRRSRNGWS